MEVSQEGHRERLRSKYAKCGVDSLHDYEFLELMLTYAIQRRDVKPIAKKLIARFGSLSGIIDADLKDVCEVEGIGENSALLFKIVRDMCVQYLAGRMEQKDVISSPEDLRDYARMKLSAYTKEVFVVVYLNTKNHVISTEVVSGGTIDHAVVYPRNVAESALKNKAAAIIIMHNHPSGMATPSSADIKLTEAVRNAVLPLDIRLLDHIVVTRTACFSFFEKNLIKR